MYLISGGKRALKKNRAKKRRRYYELTRDEK